MSSTTTMIAPIPSRPRPLVRRPTPHARSTSTASSSQDKGSHNRTPSFSHARLLPIRGAPAIGNASTVSPVERQTCSPAPSTSSKSSMESIRPLPPLPKAPSYKAGGQSPPKTKPRPLPIRPPIPAALSVDIQSTAEIEPIKITLPTPLSPKQPLDKSKKSGSSKRQSSYRFPPTPTTPHSFSEQREAAIAAQRRLAKLTRTLGENVPAELVSHAPKKCEPAVPTHRKTQSSATEKKSRRRSVSMSQTMGLGWGGYQGMPSPYMGVTVAEDEDTCDEAVPVAPRQRKQLFGRAIKPAKQPREPSWVGEWNVQDISEVQAALRNLRL